MLGGGYSDQISAGLTKWHLFWRQPPADLKKINKYINKNFFSRKKFEQTRNIVYCPHSRIAARQPSDVISVDPGCLGHGSRTFPLPDISGPGPLKRRLSGLICTVHPTARQCDKFGMTPVVQLVVQTAVKCKHRGRVQHA